jgi:hypothetical protein
MDQWCYNLWGKDSRFQGRWWSFGTDMSWLGEKTHHKFYFKNAEDAALFKLTWHR